MTLTSSLKSEKLEYFLEGNTNLVKLGIVAKTRISEFGPQLVKILERLYSYGCQVFVDQKVVDDLTLENVEGHPREALPAISDALIVFGGDGTLLSVARLVGEQSCPILGVNLGALGFLTEVTLEEFDAAASKLVSGDFRTSRRSLLEINLLRQDGTTAKYRALNDAVINKGALARIISMEAYCDEDFIANFLADGIIVATSTGSTAYSLSAGGPIVHPTQDLIVLTPICPHTLTNRPLILPRQSEVRIRLKAGEEVMLTVDGQVGTTVNPGDEIRCRLAEHSIELVDSSSRNFFDVLRQKLKWAERL